MSTFYLNGTVTAGWPAAVKALFTAITTYCPTGITWTVPNDVDILDVDTGELTGANSPGGGGTVNSNAGPADYKPGVGARIRWGTTGVVGGRRVKGTTFIVPTTSQEMPNGVLTNSTMNSILTAANAYRNTTGITPAIYSRPRDARTVGGVVIPARAGTVSNITSATVPTQLTWLRTRRV